MGRGRSVILIKPRRKYGATYWGCRPGVFLPPETKIVITPQEVEAMEPLTKQQLAYILFKGGNTVSDGTIINSSRTKPRLGPSNK